MSDQAQTYVTYSDVSRQLLKSAELDVPAPGAVDRALCGLGFMPVGVSAGAAVATAGKSAGAVGASSAGATTAAKIGALAVVKWVGIGLLGSLAVISGVNFAVESGSDQAKPRVTPVEQQQQPAAAARAPRAERVLPSPLAEPEPERERTAGRASSVVFPDRAPRSAALDNARSSGAFALPSEADGMAQLAALASIRRALSARQPSKALGLLDDFAASHPSSKLAEEAAVLRIESLRELGRMPEASQLGARFLSDHPASVHAPRVRAALEIR